MSKLEELIQKYCPDGVEYHKIKEVYKRIKGTPITAGKMKEIATPDGPVRIFAGGKTVIDANEEDIPNANITRVPAVLVQSRGVIDAVYYDKPFTFKNEMWAYTTSNQKSVKYLYYVLKNNIQVFRDAASGMGSLPQISLGVTEDFEIPIPPLPVQEEIVRVLDTFTELQAELQAELQKRKKQYSEIREALIGQHRLCDREFLGDLFPFIRNGFVGTIKPYFTQDTLNGIRYLEGTNIHNGKISDNEVLYVTRDFHNKHIKNELKADDILMVQSGHIGECAVVGEKYKGANCHALIIMSNGGRANPQYVVHYFHTYEGFKALTPAITGGTVKHVLAGKMGKISIPLPPLDEQNRVVSILDRFEALTNDLAAGLPAEIEKRRQQYEFYRDKLLTFKRK